MWFIALNRHPPRRPLTRTCLLNKGSMMHLQAWVLNLSSREVREKIIMLLSPTIMFKESKVIYSFKLSPKILQTFKNTAGFQSRGQYPILGNLFLQATMQLTSYKLAF